MSYLRKTIPLSWRWLAGLSVAFLFLLLAVACDGDDKPSTQEPTATATPVGTETPEGEPTVETATELQELAQNAEAVTAQITYNFSSAVAGEVTDGTWTLTQRPPDSRIDFTSAEGAFIVIQVGGTTYLCTEAGGQGQCLSVPVDQAAQQTNLFQPVLGTTETLAAEDGYDIVGTSERDIAGVNAKCYQVEPTGPAAGFDEAEVCFSEDGVLLFAHVISSEGDFTVEATEFTTDVSDADFEPPFPVTDLPG